MDDFSAMQGVVLVSQRLVQLPESLFCPPLRRAEWGFLLNQPSPGRQTLLVTRWYQRQRLHPVDLFPTGFQRCPDETLDTIYCGPTLESTSSLISCVSCCLLVNGTRARWLFKNSCFETTTSFKLAKEFLGKLLSFFGRDVLQSGSLNLVQS